LERYAWVLDMLPAGRLGDRTPHREPLVLAVGEDELKLLEIVLRPGARAEAGTRLVLVGEGDGPPPPPVDHVRKRVGFEELTTSARTELLPALKRIVEGNPARFLRFFNEAPAVSRRFHLLELLPGIGKKTMWAIVEERKKRPFESFADLIERTRLKDPVESVVGRIERELSHDEEKYRLFVPR
jgi:putative nucleotide binding protein